MFGYVTASWKELTAEEQKRYGAVYCGICREIRQRSTGIGRVCLSRRRRAGKKPAACTL